MAQRNIRQTVWKGLHKAGLITLLCRVYDWISVWWLTRRPWARQRLDIDW